MPVPDITAIAGIVSSLKAATDISKAMFDLRDAAKIQGKIIELQGVILSAQQSALSAQAEQFSMTERVRELEERLSRLMSWRDEKENYELREVSPGALVYALRVDAQTTEPAHWLCTSCFQNGKKSFLQEAGRTQGRRESIYRCNACKEAVNVFYQITPGVDQNKKLDEAGPPCPICRAPLLVESVDPHPEFGFAGVQLHMLKCSNGHTQTRNFDPSKQ